MILPHLLRFVWPIIIAGAVVCPLAIVAFLVLAFMDRPSLFRLQFGLILTPFAYPLLCWAVFSWAGHHDRRLEDDLRASGVSASAEVVSVRDLGVDLNQNPLLKLGLRVIPPDAEPFDAEVFPSPSRLAMGTYAQTMTVRVRYDPHDRSRLMLEE